MSKRPSSTPASPEKSGRSDKKTTAAPPQLNGDPTTMMKTAGPIQAGFWIPNRLWAHRQFAGAFWKEIAKRRCSGNLKPMIKEVEEFRHFVYHSPVHRMWMTAMIEQTNAWVQAHPASKPEVTGEDGDSWGLPDFDGIFVALNEIVQTSPGYYTYVTKDGHTQATEMVGTPMNAFFAVAQGTTAGVAMFHDEVFNRQFKKVLNAWNRFLKSEDSLNLLDIKNPNKTNSWISPAKGGTGSFEVCFMNPDKPGHWLMQPGPGGEKKPHFGFKCWNDFFIREFYDQARDRPFLGNPHTNINIGCETTPWDYNGSVSFKSPFWIKDYEYSLLDLFGGHEEWAAAFQGGQLYQGFLSATHYHRWNAPLSGRVVRSWLQEGTYFAIRPNQGEVQGTWAGTESQPYLGHVATRAIFIFEHPVFGFVALILIGMVEVSTCHMKPEYVVGKDDPSVAICRSDEIGHFEFGGSTHIMIFQNKPRCTGHKIQLSPWAVNARAGQQQTNPTKMGTIIATLEKDDSHKGSESEIDAFVEEITKKA